jgi:hypothetical protein
MKLLTSQSSLRGILLTSLLATIALFAADTTTAYSSDDQWRDDRRRDDQRREEQRDERIRDDQREEARRDDQRRDERYRDDQRYDQSRERQKDTCDATESEKPVRNLHPELQIAAPWGSKE